jgi:uncharacterized protein YndB with AHSA1/START domain
LSLGTDGFIGPITEEEKTMTDLALKPRSAASSTKSADFESTLTFKSPVEAVFDALTTLSSLASWWMPVSGSGMDGGELTFVFGEGSVVMRVDKAVRPATVTWTSLACGLLPEWVGTTISFEISQGEQGGSGLQFRHAGLTPQLECYDLCSLGWRTYLASLVGYVDSGKGHPVGSVSE